MVKRFRAAGLDAYAEPSQADSSAQTGFTGRRYFVNVAQPHFMCALLVWRLGRRGPEAWNTMSGDQRAGIALKALVDGVLMNSSPEDEDVFDTEGLEWLRLQLGLTESKFRQLLDRALVRYRFIMKRDLLWGSGVAAFCLIVAVAWGLAASFNSWPVWILIVLGAVFGVFTLVHVMPRAHGAGHYSFDYDPDAVLTSMVFDSPGQGSPRSRPGTVEDRPEEAGELHLDLERALILAKNHLNEGDARAALKVLESFAARDRRGLHTAESEYFKLLRICQEALGLDSRNAAAQVTELKLDWLSALKKGEELLKAGKARESIQYFRRSIQGNPGEAGTASAEEAARQGIKTAEKLMKRREKNN